MNGMFLAEASQLALPNQAAIGTSIRTSPARWLGLPERLINTTDIRTKGSGISGLPSRRTYGLALTEIAMPQAHFSFATFASFADV